MKILYLLWQKRSSGDEYSTGVPPLILHKQTLVLVPLKQLLIRPSVDGNRVVRVNFHFLHCALRILKILAHACLCLTSGNTKAVLAINNVANCLAFSCLKIDQKFYLWNKLLLHINTCQWYRSFEIAHTVPQVICKITSKPKTNPICRAERDSCYANHFRVIFLPYWGGV